MRKLFAWDVVTLDGMFEGASPWDLSFHELVWGKDLEDLSKAQLENAGLLLFGRKTYEGMASYWSTGTETGPIADAMNALPKAVISNTLTEATWTNTRLLEGDGPELVASLKAEPGKDIYIFGSAELLSSLLAHGLVDGLRLCVAPVVLGQGTPLFKTGGGPVKMKLDEARPLENGGVLLNYLPTGTDGQG